MMSKAVTSSSTSLTSKTWGKGSQSVRDHAKLRTSIASKTGSMTRGKVGCVVKAELKLFGHPGTRAPLVNWYLYEIDQKFKLLAPNHPENPHPFGQVPALKDDGGVELFESGAILNYIADKYGGVDTPESRAAVGKWVMWANASLDPILFKENDNGKVIGTGVGGSPKGILKLEEILEGKEFLVDDKFSVADVAVASYLLYVPQFFRDIDMGRWPNISAYMKRCASRDAYVKAYGDQTAGYCVMMCDKYLSGEMAKKSSGFKLFN